LLEKMDAETDARLKAEQKVVQSAFRFAAPSDRRTITTSPPSRLRRALVGYDRCELSYCRRGYGTGLETLGLRDGGFRFAGGTLINANDQVSDPVNFRS
jgi:hypothetical protein